ncbi:MAG: ribosome small subunit-dependent GTPase A [Chlamydiota bacterium]|jgi:ribosome biogenesis GTPase
MENNEYYEEDFFAKHRKDTKKQKKYYQSKDRSKYKKTNLEKKVTEKPLPKEAKKARVLSITGEKVVLDFQGKEYLATLKGSLKKEKTKNKNLIAVGDFVWFVFSDLEGQIIKIDPRIAELARVDVSGKKKQLIAVNIEQIFITVSIVMPNLKPHLVDRFLISSKKGNMHPIVLINKVDLLEDAEKKEKELFNDFVASYEKVFVPILTISVTKNKGIDRLKQFMKNKSSVFAGQSGVGKSSLINATTSHNLRVGSIVQKTYKGSHTTTKAVLLPLKEGGFCIDTPGIKSFGVWDLKKQDIIDHFWEIKEEGVNCHFPNCTHIDEPKCNVKEAVDTGKISSLRFASYHSLMKEVLNLN